MSFVQVSDALKLIRNRYDELVDNLRELPNRDDGIAEFVARVIAAENRMDNAIAMILESADPSTLGAWLQFFPVKELQAIDVGPFDNEQLEDLIDRYADFNHDLVALFELVSRSTERQATRELFERLATVERQNARDLVWAGRRQE